MSLRRWFLTIAVLACLVPDPAAAQGATRYTPLVLGWEQHFVVTSEAVRGAGKTRVAGYVINNAGFKATRVRILVDGLDAQGQIAGQSIEWIASPGPGPSGRAYYDVPAPTGDSFRVSVFSYDWPQAAMFDAP